MAVHPLPRAPHGAPLAREIEESLGLDDLTRSLQEMPGLIRSQQEALRAAREAADDARQEVEAIEAMLTMAISNEVDPRTGKPSFSNETSRKAELARRKQADTAYLQAAQKLRDAEAAVATAQADLDLLINRFSSLRKLADLTAVRMRLLAG